MRCHALAALLLFNACLGAASHSKTCSAHGHSRQKTKSPSHKVSGKVPAAAAKATTKAVNATVASLGHTITSNATKMLIQVTDKACGATGATVKATAHSGPNGAAAWLTCGISKTDPNSGWSPPRVTVDDLIVKELSEFSDTTFSACKDYINLFNKYGAANDLPPIFLASFAMQESSCNPNASGDNGDAYGLMQITSDKCGGAPNGNCADPDYNVKTGAAYFKGQLDTFGGDILLAVGQYNGWFQGMTYSQATAAATTGCCECQQNLDYLSQWLNGWIQGNSALPGTFDNLAACGSN